MFNEDFYVPLYLPLWQGAWGMWVRCGLVRWGLQHLRPLPGLRKRGLQPAMGVHVPGKRKFGCGPAIGFNADPHPDSDPDPGPSYWWQKIGKIFTAEIKLIFFEQKLQFTYPYAFIKDFQAIGEVFIPHLVLQNFVGPFGPPESGSVFPKRIRIRIQLTKMNADPCGSGCATLKKTGHKN